MKRLLNKECLLKRNQLVHDYKLPKEEIIITKMEIITIDNNIRRNTMILVRKFLTATIPYLSVIGLSVC
jgi:hypothetical protein